MLKITTSWEKDGIIKGRAKGQAVGLLKGLKAPLRMRFGEEGLAFLATLNERVGVDVLEPITDHVESAPALATLRSIASKRPRSKKAKSA